MSIDTSSDTDTHPGFSQQTPQYNQQNPRQYALRTCPVCNGMLFGMPGGRDAYCWECGYKDPCCSD